MASSKIAVFSGAYVHSLSKEEPFVLVQDGAIGVQDGKIIFVDTSSNLAALKNKFSFGDDAVTRLGQSEFLMPGLIDTHIHGPQYVNAGLGLDLPLLEWLNTYTFPTEARFKDPEFARDCYEKVVQRTLSSGTTTASYYASIHRESAEILADIAHTKGQRALVGKVSMDCFSPDYYIEGSTEEALEEAEKFVVNVLNKKYPAVRPIVTPRFALTCSAKLLKGLAEIAIKHDVHIQTHLCESKPEIARAKELFPECKTYAEVYSQFGLLGNKTVMAHCVHLEASEEDLLKKTGTGIAHCPTSNFSLKSGLAPVRNFLDKGIKVGLGTDVSGGYNPSILEAIRHAIINSKVLGIQNDTYKSFSYKDALFLATLGGAQVLDYADVIGNFSVGKYFDALIVNTASQGSPINSFPGEGLIEIIQKFLMLGDDRNIAKVFVNGVSVKG